MGLVLFFPLRPLPQSPARRTRSPHVNASRPASALTFAAMRNTFDRRLPRHRTRPSPVTLYVAFALNGKEIENTFDQENWMPCDSSLSPGRRVQSRHDMSFTRTNRPGKSPRAIAAQGHTPLPHRDTLHCRTRTQLHETLFDPNADTLNKNPLPIPRGHTPDSVAAFFVDKCYIIFVIARRISIHTSGIEA